MDEFESKLKPFTATRSKDFPGYLIIRCGHEDCPSTKADRVFLVSEREWLRPQRLTANKTKRSYTVIGRPCPYCFRTGRLPKRAAIGTAIG